MSGKPSESENAPKSKAISSLAKKPTDVTRQGTQKLKFVPTLPARRKKEEPKPAPAPEAPAATSSSDRGRGRGRGRGGPSDRGRGGGGAGTTRPPVEMTASGPFALGPALASSSVTSRRAVPKSNFTPIAAPQKGDHANLGAGLTGSAAPTIKNEGKGKAKAVEDDEEVYSEPDDGVQILDMESVSRVDYMAPDVLREVKHGKVKKEDPEVAERGVDLANALDLSESEEEEELEDIIEDFNQKTDMDEDLSLRQERLYFFQFPLPFPTFENKNSEMEPEPTPSTSTPTPAPKKVSFAEDVKAEISDNPTTEGPRPLDGIIGRLEIYKSGSVKIRLANDILLDVSAGTQASFLQHIADVRVDESKTKTRMTVLGEINKHFTVSPDIDALLAAMDASDAGAELGLDLIKMDEENGP